MNSEFQQITDTVLSQDIVTGRQTSRQYGMASNNSLNSLNHIFSETNHIISINKSIDTWIRYDSCSAIIRLLFRLGFKGNSQSFVFTRKYWVYIGYGYKNYRKNIRTINTYSTSKILLQELKKLFSPIFVYICSVTLS